MKLRQEHTTEIVAAKASISRATAYRIKKNPDLPSQKQKAPGRRRPGPLEHIFDAEVVPLFEGGARHPCCRRLRRNAAAAVPRRQGCYSARGGPESRLIGPH